MAAHLWRGLGAYLSSSSLTSMVTVLQAGLVIHEPVAMHQWLGMAGVLVGPAVLNPG
ncbi:hypothetical protein HLH34_08645 [Gluconacetobacter azotocaptans]|uniref:Uncharacterized protein n=1 Tax=Gluconacetobacter azotocaptans TaxID=142834 RepID=A0A7W4JSG9_9PROT|nr:hypothetical protein [Gluconacetobacter azotocaptans]MBB2190037.1 hypothetical protein [Gluconacetobacter azotocaptans]MBM9401792.1 hypothetical protein [Gluconacetobacter azotocaptans]